MSENLSAKYHQENKEALQKQLVKDIKIFLRKKKKKEQRKHIHEHNKNLSGDEKNKLVEYRKKYYNMRKNAFLWL